jgi:glycosyltransferase involved in cell wall biosynthesis
LRPAQIIVIDDCSTDGSQDLIRAYTDKYPHLITAIYHTRNQGIPQTRNDALRAVTGDYVTCLDGDDRYLPTKLEKDVFFLEQNPDAQIVYSNHYRISEDGTRIGQWVNGEKMPQGNIFSEIITKALPRGQNLAYFTVRYKSWSDIGFYDPILLRGSDYEMAIRLTKKCRVVYCDEPISEYRKDPNRPTRGLPESERLARSFYIYKKNLHLLDDLVETERSHIEQRLFKIMRKQAKRAAEEVLQSDSAGEQAKAEASQLYQQAMRDIHALFPMIGRLNTT